MNNIILSQELLEKISQINYNINVLDHLRK